MCLAVGGCYCSHSREVDAGGDEVRPDAAPDAGRDASGDAGPMLDAEACERVSGFRRCDFACPLMCSGADGRCSIPAQVCRQTFPGEGGGCAASAAVSAYCSGDWLCATDTEADDDPGYAFGGTCMPQAFCTEAPAAGMHVACAYSDGTPFVDGPPTEGVCPAPSRPDVLNCGGICGEAHCSQDVPCRGVSEDRPYGICVHTGGHCLEESPTNHFALDVGCPEEYGERCVCLVPSPQALDPDGMFERGWAVPITACLDYAAHNPGHARCVDGAWNAI